MNNKEILEAMALDLQRVANGAHQKSYKMAEIFRREALRRKEQLDASHLSETVQRQLQKMENSLQDISQPRAADDALTYSTIFLSLAKKL